MVGAVSTEEGGEVWSYMFQNATDGAGEGPVITRAKKIEGLECFAGRAIRGEP